MNQKIKSASTHEDSPLKILGTLFFISVTFSFLTALALPFLQITGVLYQSLISAYVVSFFITFTFYYFHVLPRWGKMTNDRSFIDQQIKGLSEVAIISTADKNGRITFVNENFCRISGYTEEEILGRNHRMIKSDEHDEKFYAHMWKTITKGEIWQGQIKNKAKDGSTYWVYSNIIPLRNHETGKIDEFISIRFNITHEKRLENELENEQAKNVHMGRLAALGEMAGSVAHEINNPVAVIIGKVHILKRSLENVEDGTLRDTITAKMSTIEEHAKRIAKIVKGLREFSHGGEGHHEDQILSTSLFESALELCGEKIKTNGVTIKTLCPEIKFTSSRLQLEQVLVNLINNSVDAIACRKEKWVEVKIHETDQYVHISVTDSGEGIAPEHINKIMLPFFTTKPVGKGTGLGLSISRGLIEKMGGDFFYDPKCPNTCFKIDIPKHENAIFHRLNFSTVIGHMDKVRINLDYRLKMDQVEKYQGAFTLSVPECPLPDWLMKYEARLGKDEDYKELKTTYDQVRTAIAEIEWKYINKNLCEEAEIKKSKLKLDTAINVMIRKLSEIEAKRVLNSESQDSRALAS